MIDEKINKTLDFIDLDPKFILSILKKDLTHLIIIVSLVSMVVFLLTLNLEKKYKSIAKIVIEQDENNRKTFT